MGEFVRQLLAPLLPSAARLFRHAYRHQVAVLMYHGVLPADEPLAEGDWLQVTSGEFASQMAFLRQHYTPMSLRDALTVSRSGLDKPAVVVTFDDGYANNFHHAFPILQRFEMPATIFLATSYIDTQRFFWWDRLRLSALAAGQPMLQNWPALLKCLPPLAIERELDQLLKVQGILPLSEDAAPTAYRCLTVDELHVMKNSGLIDFGSHTAGHEIIENLPDAELDQTLMRAADDLATWGCHADLFAAPNGDYLDRQIALLQARGIAACVSTQEGLWSPAANFYRIPRFGIGRGMSLNRFALKLSGAQTLLARWRGQRLSGY